MDFDDPRVRAVFFELHGGLPRQGPGDPECTARALVLAGPLLPAPRVLDIGCGPGMQTVDLAVLLPDAEITALDNHAPFLAELGRRAEAAGVGARVTAALGDMRSLAFPNNSFDLIWCEGAAYIMGFANALAAWRPLLKERGVLALTEIVWLRADPPEHLRSFWSEAYPDLGDRNSRRALIRACDYQLLGDFVLPERAWWEHYYHPLEARLAEIAPRYSGDPVGEAMLRECREEIALYRAWSDWYGYAFYVMAA